MKEIDVKYNNYKEYLIQKYITVDFSYEQMVNIVGRALCDNIVAFMTKNELNEQLVEKYISSEIKKIMSDAIKWRTEK